MTQALPGSAWHAKRCFPAAVLVQRTAAGWPSYCPHQGCTKLTASHFSGTGVAAPRIRDVRCGARRAWDLRAHIVRRQGDSAQFFLRTARTPYDEIPPDYDVPPLPGLQPARTIGYTLMVRGALTAAALATTRYTHGGVPTEINVAVRELPIEVSSDSTTWAADFDVLPIAQAVSPRVAAHPAALARLPKSGSDVESQSLAWTPPSLGGRFVRSRDGGMRFEQTVYTGAGGAIVVRGERISKTTLKKARGEQ